MSFVVPSITNRESKGPEEDIQPLSRYSVSDGVYPLLYHLASRSRDLQKSAHCNKQKDKFYIENDCTFKIEMKPEGSLFNSLTLLCRYGNTLLHPFSF